MLLKQPLNLVVDLKASNKIVKSTCKKQFCKWTLFLIMYYGKQFLFN